MATEKRGAERRIIKVFALDQEQDDLARKYPDEVIHRYEGFILLSLSRAAAEEERRSELPSEDITSQFDIRLADTLIDTTVPRVDESGAERRHHAYVGVKDLGPGRHHYIVQFVGPIRAEWRDAVRAAKGELREPLGSFAYVVRSSRAALRRIAALEVVRWIGHFPHRDRLRVADAPQAPAGQVRDVFNVDFFGSEDKKAGIAKVRAAGAVVLSAGAGTLLVVRVPGARRSVLSAISAVHGVRSVQPRVRRRKHNDVAAKLMNTASLNAPGLASPLNGTGEIIAICDAGLDTGRSENIHPDFAGRVVGIKSYPNNPSFAPPEEIFNPGQDDGGGDFSDGHGTHVAGSALGSGTSSTAHSPGKKPVRGLAWGAKLYFQAVEQTVQWRDASMYKDYGRYVLSGFPDDVRDLFQDAYDHGARVHSDSWGGFNLAEYDVESQQLDDFVWHHEDMCIVAAAGNEGHDEACTGVVARSTVCPPGTAKNCITVGASESLRLDFNERTYGQRYPRRFPVFPYYGKPLANSPTRVAGFSGRGPVKGGRIKPDVVAPGTFILSTRSRLMESAEKGWAPAPDNDDYFYMGGTSMATPLVAGACAVLRQFYREWMGIENPSAALVKASLIGTARKLDGYSDADVLCDNDQGYGLVDIDAIVAPALPVRVRAVDETQGLGSGDVHRWQVRVKGDATPLTVALAYTDYPGETLVNNLNLMLLGPYGVHYVGNDSGEGMLECDAQNNTEVVRIVRPAPGTWEIRIIGAHVAIGEQRYALFIRGEIGEPEYIG